LKKYTFLGGKLDPLPQGFEFNSDLIYCINKIDFKRTDSKEGFQEITMNQFQNDIFRCAIKKIYISDY